MGPRVATLVFALAAFAAAADTPEAAADAVLAAFRAGGDLRELAARDGPDPWLVADELCARGEHDAAEVFAKAAPRKDTEKLPAYVAAQRGKPEGSEARRAFAAARDPFGRGNAQGVLEAIAAVAAGGSVADIRLLHTRALVLRRLDRFEESARTYLAAADAAEQIGWLAEAAAAAQQAGMSATARADHAGALGAWERRLRIEESRENRVGVAAALGNIGLACFSAGERRKALALLDRALQLLEGLGDHPGVARSLMNIGSVHASLGDSRRALEYQGRALVVFEELGDRAGIAATLKNMGNACCSLGEYRNALSFHERALALREDLDDRPAVADSLALVGDVHRRLAQHASALRFLDRALRLMEELGDRIGYAKALGNVGRVHARQGEYAKALSFSDRAITLLEAAGDRADRARILADTASIHIQLGEYERALSSQERVLRILKELDDRPAVAAVLANTGIIHRRLGDPAKALLCQERALQLFEELGDRAGMARVLANIGTVRLELGEHEKALSCQERALRLLEAAGDRDGVAAALGSIGMVHYCLAEYERALSFHERARSMAAELGAVDTEVMNLMWLASSRLALGEPREAAACAREAVGKLRPLVGQLPEESGASARAQWADLFRIGTLAALDDPAEVSFFLESGRAMTLLESVGGRERIQGFVLPDELKRSETAARETEAAALARYRQALDASGDVEPLWRVLEGARGEVLKVARRIQREAKVQASLVYPEAAPLGRIRATLGEDEALVTYALLSDDAIALVATRETARIVRLGRSDAISKAAAALQAAVLRPDERGVATPPHERLDFVAKRLRALVLEPLGLKDTKRLLVAPDAELAYVPFAYLAPEVEVAYVPSGTTYGVLLDEAALRGEGVLALGDPPAGDAQAAAVYRGGEELTPLPASRAEAQAVGDVVLVGKDASETGFVKAAVSRPRWRAVHFACHGLVRPDLPELSALALGADADNDGFLTVLEVFRLKVPADLVVLSACETAKGKIYRAEGVIGLARAFMLAGSPRVICSLWKVDDAATKELMTTLYKEWKPGVGAAAALRKAQQHVASQEKWKDPYFWAAWQLWGLPQ